MNKNITNQDKFQFNSAKPPRVFKKVLSTTKTQKRPLKTEKSVKLKLAHLPFCFTGWRLVCDECAAPLHLYGENFIESYCNGRANILKCLCDLHAAERGWIQ